MSFISEGLARFVHETNADAIPGDVRNRAAHLMLDGMGIAFASSTFEFARKTVAALATFESGDCPVAGFSTRLNLRDSVLANGVLVHGLDFDDTHLTGVVHATASCFPTALGVAWANNCSGRELLTAYVLGMEAAARLGSVVKGELNQIGFHPTGVLAAFACALVAGKLERLSVEQLVMAQGIVLSMAAGTREYSTEGAWTKRMHPGWAGACGITAARLAKGGFTGPRAAYEGQFGLYRTHLGPDLERWDMDAALRGLGSVWETLQVAIKPFPACQLSIACLDAAVALSKQGVINAGNVEHIEARVPPHAVKIVCEPVADKRRPGSAYAAQFSIPYGVACALTHGKFGLDETEKYRDPALLALADKVEYAVDENTNYPRHFSGEVIVTLKSGERLAHREPINRGAADNPVTNAGIIEKYRGNARIAIPDLQAERVQSLITGIDGLDNARVLGHAITAAN